MDCVGTRGLVERVLKGGSLMGAAMMGRRPLNGGGGRQGGGVHGLGHRRDRRRV
jgi:hypothetical protein